MDQILINQQRAISFVCDVCSAMNIPQDEAALFADVLVESDLRGTMTHGIVRLPSYIERIENGAMEAKLNLQVINESPWGGVLDAGNGIGHVAAAQGMEWVIERAKNFGIGMASMRMSNHIGLAGYYPMMATQENMIGIVATNGSPLMAPTGGREAMVGNNPFAIAVPSENYPIVFDISCSKVARGKIFKAQREGIPIPPDWALDIEGNPTTDPSKALKGALLPFAEHKGFGFAFMIDLIAGGLSGGVFGPDVKYQTDYSGPRNSCHSFVAINIDFFLSSTEYKSKVQQYVDLLHKASPGPDSVGVRVPGENSQMIKQERLKTGIPYHISSIEVLNRLAHKLNVNPLT